MIWQDNGRPYERDEALTNGLRGTSPTRITTAEELHAALVRSPSLADRRPAPDNNDGTYSANNPYGPTIWNVEVQRALNW